MKKEFLVSAKEMKQLDENTIYRTGIPSLVLMERAAFATAQCVMQYLGNGKDRRILVVAGNGNNGADGICAGRILKEYGYRVDICLLISNREYTQELILQKKIASRYGISFLQEKEVDLNTYSIVVDAIFGIGLNKDVEGTAQEMIRRINASDCYVFSVDIPSGINASTGEICKEAIKADETITFGFYKCGQFLYPGRKYCGKLTKATIGIDDKSFYDLQPSMFTFTGKSNNKLDFMRDEAGNKGSFGKVLVIAGRESGAGAALLCATSALRSGCGMVTVMTQGANKEAFLCGLPEAMTETFTEDVSETELREKLKKWLSWADVCVIGCGLGKDRIAYTLLKETLVGFDKPVVADADALHLLAENAELREILVKRKGDAGAGPVILTPHPGELSVLARCKVEDIKKERIAYGCNICDEYGVILVAKDADTLCMTTGSGMYLNCSGNSGMSTAGSGDVLAGIIGSFVAQALRKKADLFEAVCLAVYVHGLAGDYQGSHIGASFMVASDIIEAYKYILK